MLKTIVNLFRVVIISNHFANISKCNELLAAFRGRKLIVLIVCVVNKYTFLGVPEYFNEPLST